MQPVKKARIGLALALAGVALAFLLWYSVGYLYLAWYRSRQISALAFATLVVAPSVVLAVVGLVGYSVGRRDFWKMYLRGKRLLAVLGLALMFVGGFFVAYTWSISVYAADNSQQSLTYYLANNSPYFVLFVLWFMTGLLVFADSLEAYWKKNNS
jgi:hypothetical protein